MRPMAVIALCGLLMGCQSLSAENAALRGRQDDAKCQSFGAQKGTQAYLQCRLTLEHDRSQVAASAKFGQNFARQGTLTDLLFPER